MLHMSPMLPSISISDATMARLAHKSWNFFALEQQVNVIITVNLKIKIIKIHLSKSLMLTYSAETGAWQHSREGIWKFQKEKARDFEKIKRLMMFQTNIRDKLLKLKET